MQSTTIKEPGAAVKKPWAGGSSGDQGVLEGVKQALARSGYAPLQRVRVEVHEGLVVLRGRLSSYYHKQRAQEAAKRVPGVEALNNEIVVDPYEP